MSAAQASVRELASRWSVRRISILLTIIALLLWSHSIVQARFDIGFYGLVSSFPATYFVALGILTIASALLWISREDEGKLLCLQLCFLIVSIWLAPVMVGGAQPILQESYYDLGRIEYIIRQGHIDPQVLWEQAWPAGWIFWAVGVSVSGSEMDGLAKAIPWIPFLWQVALFFPVFIFFRNTIGRVRANYCWAAMWVFYLGSWSTELDTGAHSFGIFFVFSILALFTMTPASRQRAVALGNRTGTVIVFAATAVAHLLGSLTSLAITAVLCISRRVRPSSVAILAVLIAAWSVFGATDFFATHGSGHLRELLRIHEAVETTVHDPLSGNASHAAVAAIRIITAVLFGSIALAGALWSWRHRLDAYTDITVAAIAVGCSLSMVGIGTAYGTTGLQRSLTFLMPAIAYFAVKLLHSTKTAVILGIVLLVALPLSFISMYGNQAMDYMSRAYVTGANFFQDNTDHGFVTGNLPMGRMKYQEFYLFTPSYEELEWEDDRLVYFGGRGDRSPHYVCISSNDSARYAFLWNDPDFIDMTESRLQVTTNTNLVYSNPDMSLYLHERE
jgi:hypothetical protein